MSDFGNITRLEALVHMVYCCVFLFICIVKREIYKEVFNFLLFKFKVQPKSEERNVPVCLW
jgi:hypothetical protein